MDKILCSGLKLLSLRYLLIILEARTGAWVLDVVERLLDILLESSGGKKVSYSPVLGGIK